VKTSIAVALGLIVAYGALIFLTNSGAETLMQMWARQNRNAITAYATTEPRQVVFAGSSLTAIADFPGFESCIYNLGLIGESALTGMDVVRSGRWMPKTVFVEINFPDRGSNADLMRRANGWLARNFPDFVYTSPVTYVAQLGGAAWRRFRAVPAGDSVGPTQATGRGTNALREAELAIQREFYETKFNELVLRTILAEFAIKIGALQKNGLNVVLLEWPIHPQLEDSPRARQLRDAFRRSFPNLRMVNAEELAKGLVIKTMDGTHLADADLIGVLRNFTPELQAACAKHAP